MNLQLKTCHHFSVILCKSESTNETKTLNPYNEIDKSTTSVNMLAICDDELTAHQNTPKYTKIYQNTPKYTKNVEECLVYFGVFWCRMGAVWCNLVFFGVFWEQFGVIWCILV